MQAGSGVQRRGVWVKGAVGVVVVGVLLAGCTSVGSAAGASTAMSAAANPTTATTTVTASTTAVPLTATRVKPAVTVNDLKNNSAHHDVAVDGEAFHLKVDYFTSIDAATWGAIGPKDVHLLAYLNPVAGPKPPDVVIDEVDSQFALLAANSGLDSLVTADTQDRVGPDLPGFLITSKISYGTIAAASGITTTLMQRWAALGGPLPIEEESLQMAGVYGVRMSFVYRLLVRNTGDAGWHRRTVVDELTVPVRPVPFPVIPVRTTNPSGAVPTVSTSTAASTAAMSSAPTS